MRITVVIKPSATGSGRAIASRDVTDGRILAVTRKDSCNFPAYQDAGLKPRVLWPRQSERRPQRRAGQLGDRVTGRKGESSYSRELTASGAGKFSGTGSVTLPVAAHSAPRTREVMNPMQRME